jgi:hypothetical protein
MAELNEHIKQVMGIKPKLKKNYTKVIVWSSMVLVTVLLWTLIYNLIF